MIDVLKPLVEALEKRASEIPGEESHELGLVLFQVRQLLDDGDFITSDHILGQISQRIDHLNKHRSVKTETVY